MGAAKRVVLPTVVVEERSDQGEDLSMLARICATRHGIRRLVGLGVTVLALAPQPATGRQLAATSTPAALEEAIRLAGDEKAARRFLEAYVLQTRAGWGHGPLLGSISTPFARVVQAALTARKQGNAFAIADVTPELMAPELHVIVLSQQPTYDESTMATVRSVFLAQHGAPAGRPPSRTEQLTKAYQSRYGIASDRPTIVAVFPLEALTPDAEVRVVFDRIVRGATSLSGCGHCAVPLDTRKLR
jgi:hypothetical protein